jgi:glucokinase
MTIHIAIDIGGTQLRAAAFAEDSLKPIKVIRIPTRDEKSTPLERLQQLITQVWPADGKVASIAVAAPGPTDPYRGIVIEAPNIPGWVGLPLRSYLENHFRVPVALGNDANLAALGEWKFGAGMGHSHMIYVTISTGIGGGIISDNRMLLGAHGLAGEIGHVTVVPDGPACGCGGFGHLEAVASGTAITHWVQQELEQGAQSSLQSIQQLNAKVISEAAKKGDWLAISALSRAAQFIGVALADLLHIFNPTAIIIGGGVSRSGSLLLDPMFATMQNHVMNPGYLDNLVLREAKFGDDAGLMGALALARTTYPG